MSEKRVLLEVMDLCKEFPIKRGFFRSVVGTVHAVNHVDLKIYAGESFGLVGESGCGKTTLGKCLLDLLEATSGKMLLRTSDGETYDIGHLKKKEARRFRRKIQFLFQDPYSSLNPRMTVYDIIDEPLKLLSDIDPKKHREVIRKVFEQVGLKPELLSRYPHSFSGGQRQRISMARSLVLEPELVVADEPVSALDVSIQAQILNLYRQLQRDYDLTYIFISHDLAVIRYVCDRLAVMYLGSIVEIGETEDILSSPAHPYTELLIGSIPKGDKLLLNGSDPGSGEVPDPIDLPKGCPFHTRCRYCRDKCRNETPELRESGAGRMVKCHFPLERPND